MSDRIRNPPLVFAMSLGVIRDRAGSFNIGFLAIAAFCALGVVLAWVLARGDDVVPIPGTRHIAYLEENVASADIVLTPEDLRRIDEAAPVGSAAGMRYPDMSSVDA